MNILICLLGDFCTFFEKVNRLSLLTLPSGCKKLNTGSGITRRTGSADLYSTFSPLFHFLC